MPTPLPPDRNPTPDSLFAAHLARKEAGETPDFEALCLDHPEHAAALRELYAMWKRVRSIMDSVESGGPTEGSFAVRLKEKYGEGVDPEIALDAVPTAAPVSGPTDALIERLKQHAFAKTRYRLEGEFARGGMGAILKIWDEDLRRHLAMKVILGRGESPGASGTPKVEPHQLARFLEEAQVTGQLDHPGIVPVHELGLDSDGRVYFTMKLVKGRDLKRIFDIVFEGKEGWNETRALSVMLKVCEAMAYAHTKGVIHRDLKPANVMVGNFGEVYVMDWGLARVLGRKDSHDIRIRPEFTTSLGSVQTERRDEREDLSDSPVVTMDGVVVGTPSYMSPEQARGEIEKLGPRADVYAIGAMLYHLLARQAPYVIPGARVSNRTVLGMVLQGPPVSLATLRKDVPAELVAICEKAMAREASRRYADTMELAEDLRAYLERRVVKAFEAGAWAEAKKWVQRNKPLAAALAGAAAILVAGAVTSAMFATRATEKAAALEVANTDLAAAKNSAEEQAYVANIIAADASLRSNEVPEAKRRLNACEERLRGWEWRHLHLASDTSVAVLLRHGSGFSSVAVSPDGSRIVTGSYDKSVRVRDATRGANLLELRGHDNPIRSVAISPDGSRIVSGSNDYTIRVWNATSGENLLVLREDDSSAFNPDGSRIVSVSLDKAVRPGNASSSEDQIVMRAPDFDIYSVAFSPDGSRIVSGSYDKTVRVWNVTSGENLLILRGHDSGVYSVAFSPDGSRIVSGSNDKTIRVWNAASGENLLVLRGHDGLVDSVAFSFDGSRIVSGSNDKTVRVWNAASGENQLVLRGHDDRVSSVAFSPDSSRIVSGSHDNAVRVWDATGGQNLLLLRGHDSWVRFVAFNPDGSRVFSGSADDTVRVWNATVDESVLVLRGHDDWVNSVAFSPDSSRIGSGSVDNTVRVWDATSGENLLILRGHDSPVWSVAFNHDGSRILSGSLDKTIRVWNATSGENLLVLRGHDSSVYSVAFSPDGSHIASASADKTVRVWNATSGENLLVLRGHDSRINSVAFSPDGSRIVSGSGDKTIRVWSATSGESLLVLRGHDSLVDSVAFSPNGARIVSGSGDKTIRVWNATSGENLLVLRGHDSRIDSVAFSPDGSRIVSGSVDKTIRVWSATSGENLLILRGHDGVDSVAFSPDGSRIASGSVDKTVRIWESSADMIHDPVRAVVNAAAQLVPPVFDRFGLVEDVIDHLQSDALLREDVRAVAIRVARVNGVDPSRLNNLSWSVVKLPGGESQAYARAARLAEAASRLQPENGLTLNTLGVAQYRAGKYEKALATLTRSDQINKGTQASDLAFLAMANHRLGHTEAAQAALARLRKLMEEAGRQIGNREEAESFLSEAETLIGK